MYLSGETQVHALRGVDIDIPRGEFVVMLGPSGSGKSTFLNIIGGLDKPTKGEVFYKNRNLSLLSSRELTLYRRDSIGFVFQAYNLVPSLTALENVTLVTEISDNPMDPRAALEIVGLEQRANHFPSQLSGGEQQRVAIARALAKQPEVLLCDEPTGALDSETGALVLEALLAVNRDFNTTCVIITHNASIAKLAHRVIYFADGKVSRVELNESRLSPFQVSW
ncbi:ABC transporter ATP-binding protein [Aliikangiella sp. G2MR2-5]|uniref:ABC transporter ATP-binding protein n=1 Tax=Aliikangiella sp. G2MR2-5 TaxID=2788943 RepID=UPI00352CF80D